MIEATTIATQEGAWLSHWLHTLIQYGGLLTFVAGAYQFYRMLQKERQERQQERQDVAVWRARMEERVKCLEKTGG